MIGSKNILLNSDQRYLGKNRVIHEYTQKNITKAALSNFLMKKSL